MNLKEKCKLLFFLCKQKFLLTLSKLISQKKCKCISYYYFFFVKSKVPFDFYKIHFMKWIPPREIKKENKSFFWFKKNPFHEFFLFFLHKLICPKNVYLVSDKYLFWRFKDISQPESSAKFKEHNRQLQKVLNNSNLCHYSQKIQKKFVIS